MGACRSLSPRTYTLRRQGGQLYVSCTISSDGVRLLCLMCGEEQTADPALPLAAQARSFIEEHTHPHIPVQRA